MSRYRADHFPPHGLEDAHEFFRQGDDGEYAHDEPGATDDPLLAEDKGSLYWTQLERQLERRARFARGVMGLMLALSLATVLVFALRSSADHDSQASPAPTESAWRVLGPSEEARSQPSSPVASRPRIESATKQPDAADHEAAVAAPDFGSRPLAPSTSSRPVQAAVGAPHPRQGSRTQPLPRPANSTRITTPEALPRGRPRSAEPSARPYSPPTARFED